ncbi:pentatricopeptide repeat-containing protein At2g29760, chloroplastic-like [Actinidia eriantha]|uniref:pentatricopeptide repeat-containing protein At2g29760, chloroplastic-like n=1 Tax=Actinidia eriantha TaxID=165200 RepID=UPI00258BF8D6|nr:pentatricopeptide repeat-containing protein At2g29760, chloroplastic-like [Actinidia eriantha]
MNLARPFSRLFNTFSETPQTQLISKNSILSNDAVKELHAHLIRTQHHTYPSSMSDVIRSYALSPASIRKAHLAFDEIERPTLLIWNFMIRGLSQSDRPIDAINMFDKMRGQGLTGNNLTLIFVLKACARFSDIVCGNKVHVHALKLGFESYLYVCNALIHMYGSCGDLGFARKMFDEMSERDLVSWNSLVCGYSQSNRFEEVLGLFDAMRAENVKADSVTMVKVILACSHLGDREIIDLVVKYIADNHVEIDVYLGNSLIDMYGRIGLVGLARDVFDQMAVKNIVSWNAMVMGYAKSGDLVTARKLFDDMPKRDVVSWTSMITGYSQAHQYSGAVKLFQEMMATKVKPDEITIASVLSACAHLGALDVGDTVHDYIRKHNIKADVYVGNSLIDMYCKCGLVEKALEVFEDMKEKDCVSWTSVVSGLAVNGIADHALELFSRMLNEGVRPTHGAFVGILLACTHAGLVDKGFEFFESMEKDHGLVPEMKHYGCVVDLLSRSGNLDRAYEFIKQMPVVPDVAVWRILLGACKLHGNVVLAEIAKNKLLKLDPCNSGNYVLSSNTYAGVERWDDAKRMRELMEEGDVKKPSGWSSIELNPVTSSTSGMVVRAS